jgi:hypothetical protein
MSTRWLCLQDCDLTLTSPVVGSAASREFIVSAAWGVSPSLAEKQRRPNANASFTDDQVAKFNSRDFVQNLQELVIQTRHAFQKRLL